MNKFYFQGHVVSSVVIMFVVVDVLTCVSFIRILYLTDNVLHVVSLTVTYVSPRTSTHVHSYTSITAIQPTYREGEVQERGVCI